MPDRFTERAQHVIDLARRHAEELRHDQVGTGHLLVGLLEEDEGPAAQALSSVGLTVDGCVAHVVEVVGPSGPPLAGRPTSTPLAREAVEEAWRRAMSLGHGRIATEHLLLGVLDQDDGVAATVLSRARVSPDDLRERLLAAMHGVHLPPRRATVVYLSHARPADVHLAGRLADHLPGLGVEVTDAVSGADILLVLISPQWTYSGPIPCELESALRHAVRVVPVLVDGAAMPDAEPLRLLTFREVPEIRHESFRRDVERLAEVLVDD